MCHALEEEMDVARYYFDIRHGTDLLRDDEGAEFDSLDAAIRGVARSAAEIGTGRLARGDLSDVVIEIRDEHHQRIITVTASMKVDRHDLSSPPSDLGQA
jgi:predicted RNA-binding Zn ribbon-like protein